MPEKSKRIVMRDLPGLLDIEAKVRLYFHPGQPLSSDLADRTDAFSLATFGVTLEQVWAEYDRFEDIEDEDDLPEAVRHFDLAYDHVGGMDAEAGAMLLELGIDFRNEYGQPLLCTPFFKWQALAAVAKMIGTLPNSEEAQLSRLSAGLEAEAERFMKDRPRR